MVDARRLDPSLSTGVFHHLQDLLKLPTREAHSFVGGLFRCEELLKVPLPPPPCTATALVLLHCYLVAQEGNAVVPSTSYSGCALVTRRVDGN